MESHVCITVIILVVHALLYTVVTYIWLTCNTAHVT